MGIDQAVDLIRQLLRESLIVAAPILVVATVTSFALSLLQTLTSVQEQTLTTVSRLLIVFAVLVAGLPWFLRRLAWYTIGLFTDLHRYLG